ncbi:hypothetical protein [Neptunomonas japonica]|uniref:hypothetical protein n=1 Tax=Neptunomonas japonica TaxID=417574 RepID=UPI0004123032|nr:hypothetical protein [Neptunomonas japonica]
MSNYKIGRDIGNLFARVNILEEKAASNHDKSAFTKDDCCGSLCTKPVVSDEELFESLSNASPDEKTFEILKCLVTDAGDLTIRDLFARTSEDVGLAASNAITQAKMIGFLTLSNNKCCHQVDDPFKDDYCKKKTGKWCSLVKKTTKYMCTLASDKC